MIIAGAEEHGHLLQRYRRLRIKRGIETVHCAFQLSGNPMIIDRRGKHKHLRVAQFRIDSLHIILLNALALSLPMTVFAGKTSMDIHSADMDHLDLMPVFFRGLLKGFYHSGRIPVRSRAAVQYKNLHAFTPPAFHFPRRWRH